MDLNNNLFYILLLLEIWTLPWKGLALWKAAKAGSVRWFIILLIVNSVGLLEIIYIFFIPPKIKFIFNQKKTNK